MTGTDWKTRYEEAVAALDEKTSTARDMVDIAAQAVGMEKVVRTVIRCGFHPFHPPGAELVEAFQGWIRNGDLDLTDVTEDMVWLIADERRLETDLTPIFVFEEGDTT